MLKTQIELNKLTSLLGDYKKEGSEYLFKCPYCIDKSENNFSFNHKKSFLWCFASNGEHSKRFLKETYNKRFFSVVSSSKQRPQKIETEKTLTTEKENYFLRYMYKSNQELLKNQKYLDFILKARGLTEKTANDCLIGLDVSRKRFVIPTIEYNINNVLKVIGFEYRPLDLSKNGLYRDKFGLTGLAQVNTYKKTIKTLIVLGGYFDCYAFYQHLSKNKQENYYHIVTSSNGEASTLKYLQKIEANFSRYEQICIYLDSDKAGIAIMSSIKAIYPKFEIITMTCGCKDFNEHYLKCIK